MNTQQAYNIWASQYDTNENKTRDLEAQALRTLLAKTSFNTCLEIGCGTGKNTEWLITKAQHVMAIDLSHEMLTKAKEKVNSNRVEFKQADITKEWAFANGLYDLITFSLVLEHIENLDHIFKEASKVLNIGGHIYIGELHPFKQYTGTKARFETNEGRHVLECFTHNISDFIGTVKKYGLSIVDIDEYFDNNDRTSIPRILLLMLKKK